MPQGWIRLDEIAGPLERLLMALGFIRKRGRGVGRFMCAGHVSDGVMELGGCGSGRNCVRRAVVESNWGILRRGWLPCLLRSCPLQARRCSAASVQDGSRAGCALLHSGAQHLPLAWSCCAARDDELQVATVLGQGRSCGEDRVDGCMQGALCCGCCSVQAGLQISCAQSSSYKLGAGMLAPVLLAGLPQRSAEARQAA